MLLEIPHALREAVSVDKDNVFVYHKSAPVLRSALVAIWKRIEVVITGLTRNQLYLTVPWVRIPPLPPAEQFGNK